MKFSVILLLLLISIPGLFFGQDLNISGVIPGGESAEVRLIAFSDYISFRQDLLDRKVTGQNGEFRFSLELQETRMITLEVGYYTFSFFVEKSGDYVLQCDTIDLMDELRPLYNKEPLPGFIGSEPAPGLNTLIGRFNGEYNDFILSEFGGIYQKRNTRILTNFRDQQTIEYAKFESPFLDEYIAYKLGVVELAMAPAKRSVLFNVYLKDRPVMLFHPEYMDFFNSFFEKHIFPGNKFIPRADLYSTINRDADFHALIDTLGKDTLLRNEVIRELVCLKTLKELYYSNDFSRSQNIKILQEFQQKSKFQEHREIAMNLIRQLTHLQKGYSPEPIEMESLYGGTFSLLDLKGKPAYIMFFTTWSFGCLTELDLMKDLYSRYGDKVNFLSISLDNNPEIVRKLIEEKEYHWNFTFNGLDYDLLYEYRIKTFPVFLLLDQEGQVVEYPAYKPSEIINESFDRLLLPE